MRSIVVIFFLLISCRNATVSQKVETSEDCENSDILLLKEEVFLNSFVIQLDSVKSMQKTGDDSAFFIEVNKDILLAFIDDIDIDKFNKESFFSKEYQNLPKTNKSGIVDVEFYVTECRFRLSITCRTIVDRETIDEGTISYSFKILNGEVTLLNRNVSG